MKEFKMSNLDENEELNEILENDQIECCETPYNDQIELVDDCPPIEKVEPSVHSFSYNQFSTLGNDKFTPCGSTVKELLPGVYTIDKVPNIGIVFEKIDAKIDNLIKFPDSNSEKIVGEIAKFWEREDLFKKHKLIYKRGMLIWGPAGSGKSCTIQQVICDVIGRNGIVIVFQRPSYFMDAYNALRSIQPNTPLVVIMEDLDEIISYWGEDQVLQILDGIHKIHKTVFLATTNYPEKLKARVVNRPSRFDKRIKIGFPNSECRRVYFENIRGDEDIDIKKWVDDTEGFSFAHMKELFVSTKIIGDEYETALETLKSMKQKVESNEKEEYDKGKVGFTTSIPTH